MAYNFVTVTVSVVDQDLATTLLSGTLHFEVSDFVWDTSSGNLVAVDPVDLTATGAYAGNMQVPLLAMDNSTLSTNWTWLVSATLPGVNNVPTRKLTVNYGNGATQTLESLLAASTVA